MRRANTTFVNLRAALDDLDPLVEDSKPVAKKLRPFLAELRPLARDARPTLRDLADDPAPPGADNDARRADQRCRCRRATRRCASRGNGAKREGAFPASARRCSEYVPEIASVRPYAPDALGWFDDFSDSGVYDALGAASRVGIHATSRTSSMPVPIEPQGAAGHRT